MCLVLVVEFLTCVRKLQNRTADEMERPENVTRDRSRSQMAKVNMALTNDKGEAEIKPICGENESSSSSSSSSSSDSEDD